jgi:hypothetical protein
MSRENQIALRRRFDEMDAAEALAAFDKAGIKEAVQPTADLLPFGPGEWPNEGVADQGGLDVNYLVKHHQSYQHHAPK